jgi:hypothetical protein
MDSFAKYQSVLSYFHATSPGVSNGDYRERLPLETKPLERNYNRIEYSRLFEEIEFLSRHWDPEEVEAPLLVVQGAYPNTHYRILTQLFPTLSVELWGTLNITTMEAARNWERIQVYTEDLTVQTCLDKYGDKKVFFVSYCNFIDLDTTKPFVDLWNEEMNQQTLLAKSFQTIQNSLSFVLPDVEQEVLAYYRGYINPVCLSPAESSLEDRVCRCIPIKEDTKLVQCNYSISWFEQVLNYWNMAAKKGRLLHNSLNGSVRIFYTGGYIYMGVEMCRVVDILSNYLEFSNQIEPESTGTTKLEKAISLLKAIDVAFERLGVEYSLAKHSERYKPETPLPEESEETVDMINISYTDSFRRAKAMLRSEATITDLTL